MIEFWISRFLELLFLCQMHISVFKCSFFLLKVTCSTIEFILQKERSPWFYHPSSSLPSPRILWWSFSCLWHTNGGKLPSGLLLGAPLCIVLWYKIKEQSVLLFLYGVETPSKLRIPPPAMLSHGQPSEGLVPLPHWGGAYRPPNPGSDDESLRILFSFLFWFVFWWDRKFF